MRYCKKYTRMRDVILSFRDNKQQIDAKLDVCVGLKITLASKNKRIRRYFTKSCVVFHQCVCLKKRIRILNQNTV
jgi:hypothetical protein